MSGGKPINQNVEMTNINVLEMDGLFECVPVYLQIEDRSANGHSINLQD